MEDIDDDEWSALAYLAFSTTLVGVLAIVVPNMVAFGSSIQNGLAFIDWFYPWVQNHTAFLARTKLIRGHIVGNGASLVIGLALLWWAPIGAWMSSPDSSVPIDHSSCDSGSDESSSFVDSGNDHRGATWAWWTQWFHVYYATLIVGSACAMNFSAHNRAHGLAGTLSFAFMAAGAVIPATAGVWYASTVRSLSLIHI